MLNNLRDYGSTCLARRRNDAGEARRLLPLDRPPADVAAAEAFRPSDPVDGLIGALLRFADGPAQRADVQHAPAIGEDAPSFATVPAWKISTPSIFGGLIEAFDARALLVVAGIALGRHDHGERVSSNQRRSKFFNCPSQEARSAGTISDIIRSISTWHSGSPKRTLYSTSFGPFSVSITPA